MGSAATGLAGLALAVDSPGVDLAVVDLAVVTGLAGTVSVVAADVADAVWRRLAPGDCERVAALIRHAFSGLDVDPPPSALRVTAGAVQAHFDGGGGGVVADPARACLLWAAVGDGLALSRLAVDPLHRRQGLALAMLAAAEQEARRRGLAVLRLSTRLALPGNRRLFERCGFVETGRAAHPGFGAPTSVDLERRLADPGRIAASVPA